MKKISFLVIAIFCFVLVSCSQVLSSNKYYNQQQKDSSDELPPLPPPEPDPEPDDVNVITMFTVLGADGAINEALFVSGGGG